MNGTPALIRGSSSATRRRTPEHQPPHLRHPVAYRRGSCRPCSLGASAQCRSLWRPAGLMAGLMARATRRFLVLLGPFCLQLCFARRLVTHVPTMLLPEGHVAGLPRRLFSRSCSQHPLVVLVPPQKTPHHASWTEGWSRASSAQLLCGGCRCFGCSQARQKAGMKRDSRSALELSASHRPFPSNFVSPSIAFQTMLATCPGASAAPLHTRFPPAADLGVSLPWPRCPLPGPAPQGL